MSGDNSITNEIKLKLYADTTSILSTKIRYAWSVLQDNQRFDEQQRLMAYHYLIFVFDLHETEHINTELHTLMENCERHWPDNPNYIPHKTPYYLNYPVRHKQPQRTAISHHSTDVDTDHLLDTHEALDVNSTDKVKDIQSGRIRYLNDQQRAQHRVLISHYDQNNTETNNAFFYDQQRHLFSTKNMIAHGKKGYAAFTLNINGELSVFNHKCTKDGIAHSSMNAGAPVISAGELMIHNGRLISINTFSGHYEPSLYSQLRILDHFSRRGIDLSATMILTQQNPEQVLNQHLGSMKSARNWTCQQYATPALALIKPFREQVKLQMKSFKCQADRKLKTTASHRISQAKQYLFCFRSGDKTYTGTKVAQYSQCKRRISLFIAKLEREPTATAEKTQREIDDLKGTLATLKRQNNMLRQRHSKMPNSGRLHKQVTQLTQLLDRVKTTSAITAIERRKQRLSTTY